MMGSDNDVPRPTEPEVKGKISDSSLPWYWQIYPFLRNTKCK